MYAFVWRVPDRSYRAPVKEAMTLRSANKSITLGCSGQAVGQNKSIIWLNEMNIHCWIIQVSAVTLSCVLTLAWKLPRQYTDFLSGQGISIPYGYLVSPSEFITLMAHLFKETRLPRIIKLSFRQHKAISLAVCASAQWCSVRIQSMLFSSCSRLSLRPMSSYSMGSMGPLAGWSMARLRYCPTAS